ncbi:MAG: ABC transporter permease [Gammaproteobacteria bacterium]|nr:ABC transporter permease [Gammaproteobacteria bacterium]
MKRLMNQQPTRLMKVFLGMLPFIIIISIYLMASNARLQENARDKLLPSVNSMANAVDKLALQENKRTGEYTFWQDTASSMTRLAMGVGIAALIGLTFGIINGAIPLVKTTFSPVITTISLIPPLALLPILFIVFGLGELSKVVLIAIGITPFIIRDLQEKVIELPSEQKIKAQTLGASTWQVIIRVIIPQILPRLITAVRLSLGAAWLFLIAAEAIASTDGLGYRIFLVRRYMSMDIIIPYVMWITFLAFLTDYLLRKISERAFPWFHTAR